MILMIFIKALKNTIPNKEHKILIAFDDMIADMLSSKNLNPVVTGLFIRGRKLNISLVFINYSYFDLRKTFILNSTHYFIMKILKNESFSQFNLMIH